jgi:hypothetical protein
MHTPNTWMQLFEGRAPHQIAEKIIADLRGYRRNSLDRATDLDTVTHAVIAVMELAHGKKPK